MTTDVKEIMKDFQKNQIKQLNHEIIIKEGYAKTWQEEFEHYKNTLYYIKNLIEYAGGKFNNKLLTEYSLNKEKQYLKDLYKYEEEYHD